MKRNLFLSLVLIVFAICSSYKYQVKESTIFGVYSIPQTGTTTDPITFKLACAANLHAGCLRDAIQLNSIRKKTMMGNGYPVLMNVNLTAPVAGVQTGFATNQASYDASLATMMNSFGYQRPTIVVIENEYNNISYFNGSAKDYIRELGWAVAFFRPYGIAVADGGAISVSVNYLTYKTLPKQEAADFKARTGLTFGQSTVRAAAIADSVLNADDSLGVIANFHYYTSTPDSLSIAQNITYLQSRSRQAIICNEAGQKWGDTNPATVTASKKAFASGGVAYVCWYNGIGTGNLHATSLSREDGTNYPNGNAFAQAMQ